MFTLGSLAQVITPPEPQTPTIPGLIYGKEPQSVQEWYVAVGLWTVGWRFIYQIPLDDDRQVLDFLVETRPLPTPLQPFSTYYHRGHLGIYDKWKLQLVKIRYGVEPVVWWSDEIDTQPKATKKVITTFGYP